MEARPPDTVVRDASGAAVAGALVTARHAGSGRAVTVYTAQDGTFALPSALPADGVVFEVRGPAADEAPAASFDAPPSGDVRLPPPDPSGEPPASAFLAQLPDGADKRRLIVDCGGCHTFNPTHARKDGRARTEAEWREAIAALVAMTRQGTGFPIISSGADPVGDAAWLAEALAGAPWPASRAPEAGRVAGAAGAILTEYDVPEPQDLPHDLAVDPDGRIVVTGMFTHRMYLLDPATGAWDTEAVPVPNANPRAVDIGPDGRWWVALGAPRSLAGFDPATGEWTVHEVGVYPHSIRPDDQGRIWFNGHFSVAPERIGSLDPATGAVERYDVPPTGPRWERESTIPYGLRVDRSGVVWGTQLRGNGLVRLDPADGSVRTFLLPTPESGPRRLDVGPDGTVWIPAFGAGTLVRFDPGSEAFTEVEVPDPDSGPYVVRVDQRRGTVWIGTGHGDVVYAYDPVEGRFTAYPLPTRGALIRHLDVDESTGAVWAAYGASPGIGGKVLRIQPSPSATTAG